MDVATLSLLATVATITLFLTSARTVMQIHQSGSTGEVPFMPFLVTFVNCALWLGYGHLQNQFAVVLVNGIGLSMSLLYMAVFYNYASDRAVLRTLLAYAMGFLLFTAMYMSIADQGTRALHLGLFCAVSSIMMFGSPLVMLSKVVATQNTSSLSFPLCVMNTVVSGLWTLYGLALHDFFIIMPNGIGVLLAVGQLSLFAMYNRPAAASSGIARANSNGVAIEMTPLSDDNFKGSIV